MASLADVSWKLLEFKARSKRSGSIYEPLKLSILQREDEPMWEKLDRYYNAGKCSCLISAGIVGYHAEIRTKRTKPPDYRLF
ncbi:phosphorylase b kinase regulatory subunit beta-like [Nerophis ophidion]|uniref:phosphorylase b kinase regulatory subunit beta-like n=1 Tax=Nerophis ophidion TaxID=159077 RepID=UPI002AE00E60|nr:phosphorylase b kinase regulatory subunit beta-like [Nerophis ophidion]